MYSLATSKAFGASKQAQLTIVQMPPSTRGSGDPLGQPVPTLRDYLVLDAWTLALADILLQPGYSRRSVISYSNGGQLPSGLPSPMDGIYYVLWNTIRRALNFGIVVTSAAGNGGNLNVSVGGRFDPLVSY